MVKVCTGIFLGMFIGSTSARTRLTTLAEFIITGDVRPTTTSGTENCHKNSSPVTAIKYRKKRFVRLVYCCPFFGPNILRNGLLCASKSIPFRINQLRNENLVSLLL